MCPVDRDYAAGILPFAVHGTTILFLVGKDAQDGSWSDFGGKVENVDRTEIETAQREFNEETCGSVLELKALRVRMAVAQNFRMLTSCTQSKHPYYMYVLQIPYDSCVRPAFRRTVAFLRSARIHKRYVEKVDLQWVTWHELQTLTLRSVFQATVVRHQKLLRELGHTGRLPL